MKDGSSPADSPQGTANRFAQIVDHLGALLRKEIQLAQQETSERLSQATGALIMLALALITAFVALSALSDAAVLVLIDGAGLEPVWAALAVGGALAVVAALVAARAIRALKPENLAPKRTIRTLRRNAETLKESFDD